MSWWLLAATTIISVAAVIYLRVVPHHQHGHGGTIILIFCLCNGISLACYILWTGRKEHRRN
jgi:hypothetical protein